MKAISTTNSLLNFWSHLPCQWPTLVLNSQEKFRVETGRLTKSGSQGSRICCSINRTVLTELWIPAKISDAEDVSLHSLMTLGVGMELGLEPEVLKNPTPTCWIAIHWNFRGAVACWPNTWFTYKRSVGSTYGIPARVRGRKAYMKPGRSTVVCVSNTELHGLKVSVYGRFLIKGGLPTVDKPFGSVLLANLMAWLKLHPREAMSPFVAKEVRVNFVSYGRYKHRINNK